MSEPEPTWRAETGARLPISRRQMLKLGAMAISGIVGSRFAFDWLVRLGGQPTAPAIDAALAGYDASAHRWGFVVDASRCIGCGQCVVACKEENHVPLDAEHTRTWIERHTVTPDGNVTIDSPDAGAQGFPPIPSDSPDAAPGARSQFVPRLCMQCENSPCTSVCPVGATYRTEDGIVLVDQERCIGCGYCLLACPYGARYLVPAGGQTPRGIAGVADKCTFCYHRITRGQDPACVEICPVGARIFGDLNDAASPVSVILREKHTTVMRADLGTHPRVHYLGLDEAEQA